MTSISAGAAERSAFPATDAENTTGELTSMDSLAFQALLSAYMQDKPPRVWSLLVTLFGDLAQAPEAALSGATLNEIFGTIGIKPEALRVALYRLRKDGWITSTRKGRVSNYALTQWGREQCIEANPKIYGAPPKSQAASLVITDPAESVDKKALGLSHISGNLFLSSTPLPSGPAWVFELNETDPVPAWVSERLCSSELIPASGRLLTRLELLNTAIASSPDFSPIQTAALRILVVHDWRRIALKVPSVPEFVFSKKWKGRECRQLVGQILSTLGMPLGAASL